MDRIWEKVLSLVRPGSRKMVYDQLQWQRFILRTGVPATAQVLDMAEESKPYFGYVKVRFWVRMRVHGTVTYRHIQAMINKNQQPAIGDTIHIRFCPNDLFKVMVL